MKKNQHPGSSFDSFLEEEGLAPEVSARVAKRTFVHQLTRAMEREKKKKAFFRTKLGSPTTAERLFNDHVGISLETMTKAAALLGYELDIKLVRKKVGSEVA